MMLPWCNGCMRTTDACAKVIALPLLFAIVRHCRCTIGHDVQAAKGIRCANGGRVHAIRYSSRFSAHPRMGACMPLAACLLCVRCIYASLRTAARRFLRGHAYATALPAAPTAARAL